MLAAAGRFIRGVLLKFLLLIASTLALSACQEDILGRPLEEVPFTGDVAYIMVSDQEVRDNSIVIDEVFMPRPGFVAIHADANGAPGPVVGYSPIPEGVSVDIPVRIEAAIATETLYALLHSDAGMLGEFEFPGPDEPLDENGTGATAVFRVSGLETEQTLEPQEMPLSVRVSIRDSHFEPADLTIRAGTTVIWENQGNQTHTVTADDGVFDSGFLNTGEGFRFTFSEPGAYAYHCQVHGAPGGGGMSGIVTVTMGQD